MRKKINKKLIVSVFFFILFVGTVVANELNLFKTFTTIPVVMAKETINKDTVITDDNVWIYQMPRELVTNDMFRTVDDVIGKTATKEILPNQYISASSLDQSILNPTAEHEFFPIPNSWLIQIQGTLRRYDLVNISAVYVGKAGSEGISISSNSKIMNDYVLKEVPVAYVKGSRNDEITNVDNGGQRLYGSQNPSNIQLSLTLEQFKELESLYLEGYQFVISY